MHDSVTRTIAITLSLPALLFATTAGAGPDSEPLGALAPLMGGTWVYQGTDDEGHPVVDRQVYEWILDQQFIKARQANHSHDRAYVTETIVGRDAESGELVFWHFSNSGKVSRGVIAVDEGVWVYEAETPDAEYLGWRAAIESLDEDRTRHTIRVQEKNGAWVDLHTRLYRRVR